MSGLSVSPHTHKHKVICAAVPHLSAQQLSQPPFVAHPCDPLAWLWACTSARHLCPQHHTWPQPGSDCSRCVVAQCPWSRQHPLELSCAVHAQSSPQLPPTHHQNHPQEYKEVTRSKSGDTGITLIPNEANLFQWRALLKVCVRTVSREQLVVDTRRLTQRCLVQTQDCRHATARISRCPAAL